MKKWKRALAGVLCVMMLETPAVLQTPVVVYGEEAAQAEAASVKNGLIKEADGKTYYYIDGKKQTGWQNITTTENGKTVTNRYYFCKKGQAYMATSAQKVMVRKINGKYYGFDTKGRMLANRFQNVKVKKGSKTVTNRYYFGKNGAAYTGKQVNGIHEIALKKIKGKTYGFCANGCVAKGIWVKGKKLYVFHTKTGVYNAAKSKQLNEASGYEKDAAPLRRLLGAPKKAVKIPGCYAPESVGSEYLLYYDNVILNTFRYSAGGREILIAPMSK